MLQMLGPVRAIRAPNKTLETSLRCLAVPLALSAAPRLVSTENLRFAGFC